MRPARHHLHGLVASDGTQGIDEGFGLQHVPQAVGTTRGEGVFHLYRAPQLRDIRRRVRSVDAIKAAFWRAGDKLGESRLHYSVLVDARTLAQKNDVNKSDNYVKRSE